jgi:hypothetical protein
MAILKGHPKSRELSCGKLLTVFWVITFVLGLAQAWDGRQAMNPDGISYLDVGDAFFRGDWAVAVSAHWSPFYPWLLGLVLGIMKPSPYWEFAAVHLVNFFIFLLAMGCFQFFLKGLIVKQRKRLPRLDQHGLMNLPEWIMICLGCSLFLWSSLNLITLKRVGPDMLVTAVLCLAAGVLVRLEEGGSGWFLFASLGIILGLGYYVKSPLFPLAFLFLAAAFFSLKNRRAALPKLALSIFLFVALCAPFIAAISSLKGHLTFGDTAKMNYAWHVCFPRRNIYWVGQYPKNGMPLHPPRRIFDRPEAFEYAEPVKGTFPLWFDPSYWLEGIKVYFDPARQVLALKKGIASYLHLLALQMVLIAGCIILLGMSRRGKKSIRDITKEWPVLVPAVSGLGMFLPVLVEPRYVAGFFLLLWMAVFTGLRLPGTEYSRRLASWVTIAILVWTGSSFVKETGQGIAALIGGDRIVSHEQWRIADGLGRLGVLAGDPVAFIGDTQVAYWARLARVRIIADIPFHEADLFWSADDILRRDVLKALAGTGARAVVTDRIPCPRSADGWQRIGETGHFMRFLRP